MISARNVAQIRGGVSKTLTLPEVSGHLADRHRISSRAFVAFNARVTNLVTRGLLGDMHHGRGRARHLTRSQAMKIAVAIELVQIGLTPDLAVSMLGRCSHSLDPIWRGEHTPDAIILCPEALTEMMQDKPPVAISLPSIDSIPFMTRGIIIDLRRLYADPLMKSFDQ